jgi:thioredoxin-related protein
MRICFIPKFVVALVPENRIMKKTLVISGMVSILLSMSSMTLIDKPVEGNVKWMTFEEAVKKAKTEKRPIFIDVYTDWCGWCKVMDKNTFNDPQVAKLLNEKFYAVTFDAEQKEDVVFNGNTFKFVPSGGNGYHQLAAALLNNQLSYPTVVFLNENFEIILPLAGYRKAPEFHKIAQFIGEGHYKTTKMAEWESKYTSPY